jgi:hypothetical protein
MDRGGGFEGGEGMTDRPIIFSAPMVRALLDGRKTMTRRLAWNEKGAATIWQRVVPGDRLWVRESIKQYDETAWFYAADQAPIEIEADNPKAAAMVAWAHHQERDHAPSIHMPRMFSRLTLIVTAAKLQRLHAITDREAEAEGVVFETADPPFWYVPGIHPHSITAIGIEERHPCAPIGSFAKLWNYLHGVGEWEANPQVVALTFTVHQSNVDALQVAAK